ncbi:MAG: glycosyltransferase family 2 protein [Clostridiaceae bacterium]|nr:glycosyltransferase family 2 protein [Clostridiaceae bacterium]
MGDVELISVIVPVYNVAAYLERCVDSIIAQTYSPLEIILVDDGATDNSGEICDAYEKKHPDLIKTVHQVNKGLSGARNTGLSYVHGKYITFVDSDDWLASDMVETMYNNLKKYGAQISGISFYQVYENGKIVKNSSKNGIRVMTREEALGKFSFNENLTVCVCGKLYKTYLWDTIKCPEGKLFEDQYTTYRLIDQTETVVFDPSPKYYYFKRQGSIGHSSFTDKTYELYWGVQEQYEYITQKYPDLSSQMAVAKLTWEIVFINMMFCAGKNDMSLVSKSRSFARKHIGEVLHCDDINAVRKVQIGLFAYCLWLYKSVYFSYKKRKGIS